MNSANVIRPWTPMRALISVSAGALRALCGGGAGVSPGNSAILHTPLALAERASTRDVPLANLSFDKLRANGESDDEFVVNSSSHYPCWWLLGQSQWVLGLGFDLLASTVLGSGPVPAGYGHGVFELTDVSAHSALALAGWSVGAFNQPAMTTFALNKLFFFGHGESLLAERPLGMVRRLLVRLLKNFSGSHHFARFRGEIEACSVVRLSSHTWRRRYDRLCASSISAVC